MMMPRLETFLAWALGCVLVLFLAGLGVKLFADDDPPHTHLQICDGNLPSLSLHSASNEGCWDVTVNATDPARPDYLNREDDASFRHVYHVEGDQACVFTANPDGSHGAVKDVSGGRDCSGGGYSQCSYIAEGWHVYAVTGKSCSEAGVPLCGGLFCK